MAASAEHGDVPFSASCGCFVSSVQTKKKGAPSLSWWDLRKTHPPIMMGFSGEDDRAFVLKGGYNYYCRSLFSCTEACVFNGQLQSSLFDLGPDEKQMNKTRVANVSFLNGVFSFKHPL